MTIETLCAKENFVKNENRVQSDIGNSGIAPDVSLRVARIRAAVDKAKRSLMIRTGAAV